MTTPKMFAFSQKDPVSVEGRKVLSMQGVHTLTMHGTDTLESVCRNAPVVAVFGSTDLPDGVVVYCPELDSRPKYELPLPVWAEGADYRIAIGNYEAPEFARKLKNIASAIKNL